MTGLWAAPESRAAQSPRASVPRSVAAVGRATLFFVAGTVTGIALLLYPTGVAGPTMDPSWAQSLGYFLKHRFQAGRQYVFPYGPLGYFPVPLYNADLFWLKIAWELGIKFLLVWTALRLTRHTLSLVPRLAFCVLTAVFLTQNLDGPYDFFLFLLGVSLADTRAFSRPRLALDTFLLAALALTKFTALVQAGLVVAVASGRLLLVRPWWRALLPPAFFGGFLIASWLALGQSLTNIPAYLSNSLEVAAGYNDAMGTPGEGSMIALALVIGALLAAALFSFHYGRRQGVADACALGMVAVLLFLHWKHGFVTQDMHQIFFFGMTLLCPFFFPNLFPGFRWRRGLRPILAGLAVLLSIVGFVHVYDKDLSLEPRTFLSRRVAGFRQNARFLLDPVTLREHLERVREAMARQFAMPEIAARVGGASVDALNYEQGVVMLNRLNWTPRPVFQSNAAYTRHLQALNAQFLAGPEAPAYLIFQLVGWGGRFPSLDDSQALFELFKRYRPILAEGNNLLFEKNRTDAAGEVPPWTPVREKTVGFDEEVVVGDLPEVFQVAQVRLAYSWRGKLQKALFKPPVVYLRVRTADGGAQLHRFIPAIAESGFLLNPLLGETRDVVDLYGGGNGKRVVALSFYADPGDRKNFRSSIRVVISGAPRVVGEGLAEAERERLRLR